MTVTNNFSRGTRGTINLNAGGTLQIGTGTTTGTLLGGTGNLTNNGTLIFKRSNASSHSGVLSGSGVLEKQGTGTLTLSGANTYSGGTKISAGTLAVGNANALGTGGLTVNGGTLDLKGTGVSVSDLSGTSTSGVITSSVAAAVTLTASSASNSSFAGVIQNGSGTMSLAKGGSGTLTLTGTNTYSGATTVTAGLLTVNGDISRSSLTTVGAGATLGGSGTIGALVVENGATIAPGNSPGTLWASGNVTWQAGGNYNWQLVDALGTAGTGWDFLAIGGALDLTALSSANPFNLNLWSLSSAEATTGVAQNFSSGSPISWTIATALGGITGFNAGNFRIHTAATNGTSGFTNDLSGGTFSLAVVDGNKLNLVYQQTSAVPEPSGHLALLGLGSAGLLTRRRLKRKA